LDEIYVAQADEFENHGRKLVVHDGKEVGVFCIDKEFVAYRNECAHQGGPVCQGRLFPRVEQELAADKTETAMRYVPGTMHVVCPWHGYEYDLRTGRNAALPRLGLKKLDVFVKEGAVYVRI